MLDKYFSKMPLSNTSLSVNNVNLEQEILGFRTLSVSGRESLAVSIDNTSIKLRDGKIYNNKTDNTRELKVLFNITEESLTECNKAIDKLKYLIHDEEIQINFNDEPDKYFIGTMSNLEISPINSAGSVWKSFNGTITFLCSDPYKYSVKEKELDLTIDDDGVCDIIYDGTYKAYPTITATMESDNGYLSIIDSNGNIIQLGDATEVDGEYATAKEDVANISTFVGLPDDTSGKYYFHTDYTVNGKLSYNSTRGFVLQNKGSNDSRKWNGGIRTYSFGASVSNCKNFYCFLRHWFETGKNGQTGIQSVLFLTEDNKVICGYNIYKSDMSGNTAVMEFIANGKSIKKNYFTPSNKDNENPFNEGRGWNDIRKVDSKITFYWFGSYPSYNIPEIKNMICTKVQIGFFQYGTRDLSSNHYVTRNILRDLRFYNINDKHWNEISNKFSKNDIVSIDCKSGDITQNGLPKPSLGAIGNDWEDFYLRPGHNKLKISSSEWVTNQPSYKIKYREVYL